MFLSKSAIEQTLRSNPAFIAPRGADGPVIDCTSGVRCDRLQIAKTSTFPECIAATFTQNIPCQGKDKFKFTVVGTIWPGDNNVELWPKITISNTLLIDHQPWCISIGHTTPIFPEDRDGDVFGITAYAVRSALQNPCVLSRMPWLNKAVSPSLPDPRLKIQRIRRQQLNVNGREVVVNGSALYSQLRDDALDFMCPICGTLQSKDHFFSVGCGVGTIYSFACT